MSNSFWRAILAITFLWGIATIAQQEGTKPQDEKKVEVPEVVGMPLRDAEQKIISAECTIGKAEYMDSDKFLPGGVISQKPAAGTSVKPGSSVDLVVAKKKVEVPNVVGMPLTAAEPNIISAECTVGKTTYTYSDKFLPGDVVSQKPGGGTTVELRSPVDLVVAQTKIAAEPYEAVISHATNEVLVWGQKIVLRAFDVELEDRIQIIPIFSIQCAGLHHKELKANEKSHVEARAKSIVESLAVARYLLDDPDAKLTVRPDSWETWRLNLSNPSYSYIGYPPAPPVYPAIYLVHPCLRNEPLRIMTVYPEDVRAFPDVNDPTDLANYIVALIKAHHLLFSKKSLEIRDYEQLELDKTREGKIFKEIFIRANEARVLKQAPQIDDSMLKDALARIPMPQRHRLVNLAFKAPRDWKSR